MKLDFYLSTLSVDERYFPIRVISECICSRMRYFDNEDIDISQIEKALLEKFDSYISADMDTVMVNCALPPTDDTPVFCTLSDGIKLKELGFGKCQCSYIKIKENWIITDFYGNNDNAVPCPNVLTASDFLVKKAGIAISYIPVKNEGCWAFKYKIETMTNDFIFISDNMFPSTAEAIANGLNHILKNI